MRNTKNPFNVPLSEEEQELRISEILQMAHSYFERGEVNAARILFDRTENSCRGMLENATFLLTAPSIDGLTKAERVRKAERLLLYVEQNGKHGEVSKACLMLSNLYSRSKEIRSLGYLLRAKRLGNDADEMHIKNLHRKFSNLSIDEIEKDAKGAYITGVECMHISGQFKWALYFLEIAANDLGPVAGLAALQIADLLEAHFPEDQESILRYRTLAAKRGNPEYITKQ